MPLFTRLVKEKVRQTTGFTGKDFQPTPNDEYMTMMKQAGDFSSMLKKTYTSLQQMKSSTESFAQSAKGLLQAPLPRVYAETAKGSGGAVSSMTYVGGPQFNGEAFSKKGMEVSGNLESEVLVPMKRWLDFYSSLQPQVKQVEDLRLEVDSRRHTVIDLSNQVDKYRTKLNKGHDAKVEANMEETIKKLQHKEGKLTLTLERFQEKAGVLVRNLETLIKGAEHIRHYLAVAFREQAAAYDAASKAIGETVAPENPLSMSTMTLTSDDATSMSASDGPRPESPVDAGDEATSAPAQ